MMQQLKTFAFGLVTLGILDFIWLGFIAKRFNNEQLSAIARMSEGQIDPLKTPVLLCYLVMALAFTAFAAPRVDDGSALSALAWGSLLGFSLYAIFDLTNYAILKDYPLPFAMLDVAWGTVAYALTNVALFYAKDWVR